MSKLICVQLNIIIIIITVRVVKTLMGGWCEPEEGNEQAEARTDWKSKVKEVITTADVLFSTRNQVKSKKEPYDRRCSIFHSKSSEGQKKGHHVRRCSVGYSLRY